MPGRDMEDGSVKELATLAENFHIFRHTKMTYEKEDDVFVEHGSLEHGSHRVFTVSTEFLEIKYSEGSSPYTDDVEGLPVEEESSDEEDED